MTLYMPPRLTTEAVALIKHFEGCFLESYCDPVGVWTIGYGHTDRVKRGQSLSEREAEDLLMEDLDIAQVDVRHNVKVPLNENEFGALVSLAFNIGGSALAHSTLVRKLNKGDRAGAAAEFERFVNGHIGGRRVTLRGLVIRRKAEREMFEAPLGTLVRDGRMVLAGRTIPVEHPSYDVAHMGPPQPPQHYPFPPYPWYPPAYAPPQPTPVNEPVAAAPPREAAQPASQVTLAAIGAGAALGAVPATNTPAAHGLISAVTEIWQRAGGADTFPAMTGWLRWLEALTSGVAEIFQRGTLAPLLNAVLAFIQSHEAFVVLIVTVALYLLRAGIGGLLFGSRR